MFHKVKTVAGLQDYVLSVQFAEGITKIYDIKPLFKRWKQFEIFSTTPELFFEVQVDQGGYGIVWNDELDLSCDELFEGGKTVQTPFDGLK